MISLIIRLILAVISAIFIRYGIPLLCIMVTTNIISRDITFGEYVVKMIDNGYVNSVLERFLINTMIVINVLSILIRRSSLLVLLFNITCICVLTLKCVTYRKTAITFSWCYSRNKKRCGVVSLHGGLNEISTNDKNKYNT